MKFLISFIFLVVSLTIQAQTIDTLNSVVRFKINNMGINNVKGTFKGMSGAIQFNPNTLQSSQFDVCIDASTIHTKNSLRDKHLRSNAFFYTDTFPTICFQSTEIKKTKDDNYFVIGNLTIRDVTKEVNISFSYENNMFLGELILNRKDYGVGQNSTIMVGDEVSLIIECKVE